MARARRSTQEEIFDEPDSQGELMELISDDATLPVDPIATEQHTIKTSFVRQVPVSAINATPAAAAAAAAAPALAPVSEDEMPPHIAKFLQEMGDSDAGWQMVVYRLPTFAKDGRTDPARRQLCGVMDFSQDYEVEIQRRYARETKSNFFTVVVKKRGVYVKGGTLPVFSCEPLPPAERILMPGDVPTPAAAAAPPTYAYPDNTPLPIEIPAPPPPVDPLKLVRDQITMMKLMREAFGAPAAEPPAPPLPPDPETTFLQVLSKDKEMMGKLTKRTLHNLLGESGAERNEWAEVAMEAVKSGQAAQIIGSAVNALFAGFAGLMPRPEAPAPPPAGSRAAAPPQRPPVGPAPLAPVEPPPTVDESQSPELQVLGLALDHCARHLPPQVAASRIVAVAQQIRETIPAYSIDTYLDLFATMDAAAALEICRTLLPDRAEITQLPHALEWTAALQDLLKPEDTDGTD